MKNTTLALMTWSVICAASQAAPIDLASPAPQSAKNVKSISLVVSRPAASVTPALYVAGGITVCTTFPGKVFVDRAGHVYKIPIMQDAKGHQFACGPAVPLSQAPIDPVPAQQK